MPVRAVGRIFDSPVGDFISRQRERRSLLPLRPSPPRSQGGKNFGRDLTRWPYLGSRLA